MAHKNIIRGLLVSATAAAITWSAPVVALAADYMTDLDATKFVPDNQGNAPEAGKTLGQVIIDVVQVVLTQFLLPLAILMSIWRSMYFAIFCVLAHTDPLHLLNERNLSMIRQTTGTSAKARTQQRRQRALEQTSPAFGDFESVEPEIGKAALKDELRKTARSLVVVMGMWLFFQMIILIVTFLLATFE